jgi:hypothetical protein
VAIYSRHRMADESHPMAVDDDSLSRAAAELIAGLGNQSASELIPSTQPSASESPEMGQADVSAGHARTSPQPAPTSVATHCERPACGRWLGGKPRRGYTRGGVRYTVCDACRLAMQRGASWEARELPDCCLQRARVRCLF